MRHVVGLAIVILGVSIAVLSGTGDSVNAADLQRRALCQRTIGYGVFPISEADHRVGDCIAAAALREAKPKALKLAAVEIVANR